MVDIKAEATFLATMNFAKKLLDEGAITKKEYRDLKARMEKKYEPKVSNLFT